MGILYKTLKSLSSFWSLQQVQNIDQKIKSWKLYFFVTPPRNCGGTIFTLQFVSVCVVSLSVCLCVCQWTEFQLNRCTDLDAVFAKLWLTALARILWRLVTLGQRSRSQWCNIHLFFIILYLLPNWRSHLYDIWSRWKSVYPLDMPM